MKFSVDHASEFAKLSPDVALDVERILSHYAARTFNSYEGEQVHAVMQQGAHAAEFDPNTGGNVWLSYSVHLVGNDRRAVLFIAGIDDCYAYAVPDLLAMSASEAAGYVWDLCGEDEGVRLASIHVIEDGHPAHTFADYCEARARVCSAPSDALFWKRQAGAARAVLTK